MWTIYIDDIWRYNTIQFVNEIVECMRYVWRNGAAKWGGRNWEYDVQSGWDCVVKTARCVQDSKGGPAYPL